jgi:hypothetical protein
MARLLHPGPDGRASSRVRADGRLLVAEIFGRGCARQSGPARFSAQPLSCQN